MKRLITTVCILFFLGLNAFCQTDSTYLKNEFGLDIVPLIEQIFNFNSSEYYIPYSPVFHVGYKRHFGKMSLRLGAGGSISSGTSTDITNDEFDYEYSSFNYRIGLEAMIYQSKKWKFYYGLDARHYLSRNYREMSYQNGDWNIGSDDKRQRLSVSPILGIEFKINDKISLQTEGNLSFYRETINYKTLATPRVQNPSSDPFLRDDSNSSAGLAFSAPNFLYITMKF